MKIPSSFKNLIVGAGGAAFFNFLAISVCARVATNEDFGVFSVFAAVVSVLSVAVNFRFDVAICQKSNDRRAFSLFLLSAISAFLLCIVAFVLINIDLTKSFLQQVVPAHVDNYQFLLLVVVAVFLIGLYQAAHGLALYEKSYRKIASSKLIQAVAAAVVQVLLVFIISNKYWALALGFVLGQCVGFLNLIDYHRLLIKLKKGFFSLRIEFKRNVKFCTISTISTLLLVMSPMLPNIFLASLIGVKSAGIFFFAVQITTAPFSMLRRVVGSIVLAELRDLDHSRYRTGFDRVKRKVLPIFGGLLVLFIFYSVSAPHVFVVLFGEQWRSAGVVSAILLPMLILDTVSYCYFQVLNFKSEKMLLLLVEVLRFLMVVVGVWFVARIFHDLIMVAIWYSVSMFVFYSAICFLGHKKFSKNEAVNS